MKWNMPVGSPAAAKEQVKVPSQVKTLFSKFKSVENPTIRDYVSSIPEKLSETIDTLVSPRFSDNYLSTPDILSNKTKLQMYARKFHSEADTLTSRVVNALTLLNHPMSKILVSIHQPNLFAYGGVYKKIVLLQTLKGLAEKRNQDLKMINLFLIIDHDFMDEMWIRVAQLPSVRHKDGIFEIRTPINSSKRWQMVCNMPLPTKNILDSWRKQIRLWIKNTSTTKFDTTVLLQNFEEFWIQLERSYSKAKSYADLNSFLMSQIVNLIWGYDTLFVRLSDISPVFENGFKYLLSNYDKYSKAVEDSERLFVKHSINTGVSATAYLNAPVWLHCQCGSKASAKIERNIPQDIILRGKCMSCKKDLRLGIERREELNLSGDILQNISPRAIPILLLLSRELGIACYASGTGGSIGYAIVGSIIFNELSVKMPLTVVWPSQDVYTGFSQSEALELLQQSEKTGVLHYLEELKQNEAEHAERIKPLLEERNHLIKHGDPIQPLLSRLFYLKEEQREIRRLINISEKVKNALDVRPCFIDYAVNFGTCSIEVQWREGLIKNDYFIQPTILTRKR